MLFNFTVFPIGSGSDLTLPVAEAVERIARSGLPYQLTGSSTLIEGEGGEVMPVIEACVRDLTEGHARVYAHVTIDYHRGESGRIQGAVRDVEQALEREIRTEP